MLERIRIAIRVATSADLPDWFDDGRLAILLAIASGLLSIATIIRTA
ncbi:hypothetical protein [Sphingopyxis macrogoltabida]|nr:hypothetical protein [Sphingopyxis macrogoltabida]ALJ14110.1 hypothetical protein LH19_14650 [Sphingopyxis macrogoltabida]